MTEDIFHAIRTDYGIGEYYGGIRVDSGGAYAFSAQITGHNKLYGRFDISFVDKNIYYLDIKSFGFSDIYNVYRDDNCVRCLISDDDEVVFKKIIMELFMKIASEAKIFPFSVESVHFNGDVCFSVGWVRKV